MGLYHDHEENTSFSEFSYEDEDSQSLNHKRRVRRMIEERLEQKRLDEECKDDFDELNDEFDWNDSDLK